LTGYKGLGGIQSLSLEPQQAGHNDKLGIGNAMGF
jgi:hypothetical protein